MKAAKKRNMLFCLMLAFALAFLSACSPRPEAALSPLDNADETDGPRYLVAVEDEPDTVDFQCTSIHYTIAQNVFDRLVEMETDGEGHVTILPSLASSWEISEDHCCYTFHLRHDVAFSNSSPLTASDVLFTLTRLLTHPNSCNRDIALMIKGAQALAKGETDTLAGVQVLNEYDLAITLEQPFEAFPACLSMPGASILDEETTIKAGDRFGLDPAWTIGTGPFIFKEWNAGNLLLTANPNCWSGAPRCDGLDLRFITESEAVRIMFENGEMDVLDLDELGNSAEYFIHGDIYQNRLFPVQQIGIMYIALNESIYPLNDVMIRKALALALNRTVLLDAVYSGRGRVENGIFPHGLYGFNPDLPAIPYDPEEAARLIVQAGYPDGLDLVATVKASSTQGEMTLMTLVASMWEKVGVRTEIQVLEEDEFMRLRKSGQLSCYSATWTADYNDPDNFIFTFFGDAKNTAFRSLCYPREEIMQRVRDARAIPDADARLQEYQELERIIVQEDAAWIPLFSRLRYYVTGEGVEGFRASWNGSVKNNYRNMSVQ